MTSLQNTEAQLIIKRLEILDQITEITCNVGYGTPSPEILQKLAELREYVKTNL